MIGFLIGEFTGSYILGGIIGAIVCLFFDHRIKAKVDLMNLKISRRTGYNNLNLAKFLAGLLLMPFLLLTVLLAIFDITHLWVGALTFACELLLLYSFFVAGRKIYSQSGSCLRVNRSALWWLGYCKFVCFFLLFAHVSKYLWSDEWISLAVNLFLDFLELAIIYLVSSSPFMKRKRKVRVKAILRLVNRKLKGIKIPTPAPLPQPLTS